MDNYKVVQTRVPVIALDYSKKHLRQKKELMVDYTNGNIYIVSAESKEKIFNVTEKIYEQLQYMEGNNITVIIEGIGEVNLVELIEQIQANIRDSVQAINSGEETQYVGKENIIDNRSLQSVNKVLQIYGFGGADVHTIPRKGKDGNIEWIELPQWNDPGNIPGGGTGEGSGDGDIIPPSNPDDAFNSDVWILEPVNNKIYLRASRRQKTEYLNQNCKVILPRTLDTFSEINWYVSTSADHELYLSFGSNVYWDNMENIQPRVKGHHIYVFKTWDKGETWFGKLEKYSKVYGDTDDDVVLVDIDYLEENYYSKEEINTYYLDKNQLGDEYYNKKQIDKKLSWEEF